MNLRELAESRIVIDSDICSGKPRIKGTRVTVSDILLALAEGMSNQEIMRNFRSVQGHDIQAALAYAFCIADNVKMKISSSFGADKLIGSSDDQDFIKTTQEIIDNQEDQFSKVLAEQASIQEEITKEKVAQIKSKKLKKSKAPNTEKKQAPKERPYDLLIDISTEASSKVFVDSDGIEQALDMSFDNYVFESRTDGKTWLAYSAKDGIEIDQSMKRNLLVTYKDVNGEDKEAVFEGYLTTDRQHKIFLQRDNDGSICGRAL